MSETNIPEEAQTSTPEESETAPQPPVESPAEQSGPTDAGQAEVQRRMDEATEKGYFGAAVDQLPNSAHSLESGPDSPTMPDATTRA